MWSHGEELSVAVRALHSAYLPSHGVLPLLLLAVAAAVVEPDVIGTLTGSLGTRHGAQEASGTVRRGTVEPENRPEPSLVRIAQAERRLAKSGDRGGCAEGSSGSHM